MNTEAMATNKLSKNTPLKQIVYELSKMEWIPMHDDTTPGDFYDKPIRVDEPLGLCVTRYPKGYYKTWHRHTMGHGIFVLEGKLRTEDGIYGAGSFVWFPEGMVTRHGATDEEDCIFLFISSVSGDIIFEEGPDCPA